MDIIDYIDWDEGRDFADASASVAVMVCENCGQTCERLSLVPEFDYMGCDDCMEEALTVIAREQQEDLMKTFVKPSPLAGPKVCVNCKTKPARWASIYCSDRCRRAFLTFPEVA